MVIKSDVLKWFENYLIGREQAVTANEVLSEFLYMLIGVPDDTAIYCSGKNINNVAKTLQTDVTNVIKWFQDNMLTVNIDKSCTLAVGTARRLANDDNNLNIAIGDTRCHNYEVLRYYY